MERTTVFVIKWVLCLWKRTPWVANEKQSRIVRVVTKHETYFSYLNHISPIFKHQHICCDILIWLRNILFGLTNRLIFMYFGCYFWNGTCPLIDHMEIYAGPTSGFVVMLAGKLSVCPPPLYTRLDNFPRVRDGMDCQKGPQASDVSCRRASWSQLSMWCDRRVDDMVPYWAKWTQPKELDLCTIILLVRPLLDNTHEEIHCSMCNGLATSKGSICCIKISRWNAWMILLLRLH